MYPVSKVSAATRRASAALLSFAAALLDHSVSPILPGPNHEAAGATAGGEADLDRPRSQHRLVLRHRWAHAALRRDRRSRSSGWASGSRCTCSSATPRSTSRCSRSRELIYETCKTYLFTQLKFLALLEAFIGVIIVVYFGVHQAPEPLRRSFVILLLSVVGIAGCCLVAWFGIRVNTFANSRTAFASAQRQAVPRYAIPLKAGMSIGMLLISVELDADARHPPLHPGRAGPARASSASPSASRSAPPRSASPAASSPRSPTSARTS